MSAAVADIPDGASIMLPGFGPGMPWNLLRALWDQGARDLTLISNTIGFPAADERLRTIGNFVEDGRVRKLIASFTASTRPSREGVAEQLVREGKMEAELSPQGTLAERIRAGGAGIPAFYTPAATGTLLAEGRETREFGGREYLLEEALFADYAFIRAYRADELGNLVYRRAARNYNPIMATAATTTIVEVEQAVERVGAFDPDQIHTPGLYVDSIVQIPADGFFAVAREMTIGGTPPQPSR
jgi:3-oxoacid CoA-transferase A subunit